MKLAVISDIHGNLPSLEAVLKSIAGEGADRIVCLGDLVGYGASPNECVDVIRGMKIPCLLGNHDEAAIGRGDINYFNPFAREAIIWTTNQLSPHARSFLESLPFTAAEEGLRFVHSSPHEPEAWHYLFTHSEAKLAFIAFTEPVCFFGHTHFPVIFNDDEGGRRLINVGSVGQPRDRDPRACWGLYRSESRRFRWIRVEYPVDTAAQMIRAAGLPDFLAQRLYSGV